MLSSILPLTSNLTLPLLPTPQFRPSSKSHICFTFSPSNQNSIGEEARWFREEQRWLREEQRWLREEARWNAERLALLQEINSLKLTIQELQQLNSLQGASASETVANLAKMLQMVKEGDAVKNVNRIRDSGSSALPLVVEATEREEEEEEEVVVISISDKKQTGKRRATLRKGSEGDEVQAMQEALLKLGFYCGEEDTEFSSFSSGTERAVKTWQASLGVTETGIMTAELLERLYGSENTNSQEHKASDSQKKSENGVPVGVVREEGVSEYGVSEHQVFLLGENRWEEPSRLSKSNKRIITKNAITKCLTCRGEGRVLCMECDGTGEPNIEEQFMEWIDEEMKCPYCEGAGFTKCDVCEGT